MVGQNFDLPFFMRKFFMSRNVFQASLGELSKGTKTMITNLAAKYKKKEHVVLGIYHDCLYEVIKEKVGTGTVEEYENALKSLVANDFRNIWYKVNNALQNIVREEGGKRAKEWAKFRKNAQEILKNDIVVLGGIIDRMEAKIASGNVPKLKVKIMTANIKIYKEYLIKAQNPESIGHFTQRLRDYPYLKSFLYKPK